MATRVSPLGRPTVKAGPSYGEWHYPPELPAGWVVAQRSPVGWVVRYKDGTAPEKRVSLTPDDFGERSQTLRVAGALGLAKQSIDVRENPDEEEGGKRDYAKVGWKTAATVRKAKQRVGLFRRILKIGGSKAAERAAVKTGTKVAVKVGAKTAAKGGTKFIPFVGEAVMVIDALPEAVRVEKEKAAIVRSTARRVKEARGLKDKSVEVGRGAGKFAVVSTTGTARVAAAALVGSDVVHSVMQSQMGKSNPASIKQNISEINQMLRNMPSDWKAQLRSNQSKLQFASPAQQVAPPSFPDAHSVLRALSLNNRGQLSSEVKPGQEPTSGNPVPEDVREAAMEGIRLSYKNNYGGYDFIGVARAIQLAISPRISDAALNRMRMYFDRKTRQDRLSDQYAKKHGKRYWSWLNWGGDPGARWSESKRFAELIKENPMYRYNPYYNPYHKEGRDQWGKVCFYIYNDDGSQVVGPTGPRFCYNADKASEMVRKAEKEGKRVSPSSVSPGPRTVEPPGPFASGASAPPPSATPPRATRQASTSPVSLIEARFERLRPILNHHLVMSNDRPHWGGEVSGTAPQVAGIDPRRKYAVIFSVGRRSGRQIPEFVVNMENMEISRADNNGQPRPDWNYGTIDEVIARGQTLRPRQNPMSDWV